MNDNFVTQAVMMIGISVGLGFGLSFLMFRVWDALSSKKLPNNALAVSRKGRQKSIGQIG